MITFKGKWIKVNSFIKEDGESISIVPWENLSKEYRNKLPLDCFILIVNDAYGNNIIKEVVPI